MRIYWRRGREKRKGGSEKIIETLILKLIIKFFKKIILDEIEENNNLYHLTNEFCNKLNI